MSDESITEDDLELEPHGSLVASIRHRNELLAEMRKERDTLRAENDRLKDVVGRNALSIQERDAKLEKAEKTIETYRVKIDRAHAYLAAIREEKP